MSWLSAWSRRAILTLLVLSAVLDLDARADDTQALASDLDLAEYHGQVVYLDFWASWCAPCQKSFPWMMNLQERYREQGLIVLTVNVDRKAGPAEKFLSKFESTLPVFHDPDGSLAEKYGLEAMPTSFVYDREGALRLTHLGFRSEDAPALQAEIEQLLAEESTNASED